MLGSPSCIVRPRAVSVERSGWVVGRKCALDRRVRLPQEGGKGGMLNLERTLKANNERAQQYHDAAWHASRVVVLQAPRLYDFVRAHCAASLVKATGASHCGVGT